MAEKGSLLFINFDDLVMKFAKYNDLADYCILVVSREFSASLKVRSASGGISTNIQCESKYDNIEFVDSIRPPAQVMEHCFAGDAGTLIELYENHLLSAEPLTDLCSIVDIIVNQHEDVIITMASFESAGKIDQILQRFIYDQFKLQGYLYSDLERLVTNYGTPAYDKIIEKIDYPIPPEFDGKDVQVIVRNIGDVDVIKDTLETQKHVAAVMTAEPGTENDFLTMFFNRFTEDLESKVEEKLLSRSLDDIKDVCRSKGIRIAPGASKESLVKKILHELRLDAKRTVEYQ